MIARRSTTTPNSNPPQLLSLANQKPASVAMPAVAPVSAPASQPAQPIAIYHTPTKFRTAPRVAKLRSFLRPRLVNSIDEFDAMDSQNPEHQQLVITRLQT